MIIVVCGLPGSGKSYFAERLAALLKAEYLSSDRLRKTLSEVSGYSEEAKEKVYLEMMRIAAGCAEMKKDLVVDATFHKASRRRELLSVVKDQAKSVLIEVQADESLIHERVKNKREYSDADFEVYKKIRSEWEPVTEDHLVIESGNNNIGEMLDHAIKYIRNHDR